MTVNSKTDIANMSSDLLGGGIVQDIENPTNATEELFSRWYDHCRRKLLRSHPWKFATKRVVLAASSTDPVFGYTKAFPLPNNCLRLIDVESSDGARIFPEDYQLEAHLDVKSILISTDAGSLRLRYVYDIEDVTKFDDMFVSYLALDLALSTAYKMTQSNGNVERIAQLEKQVAAVARSISGQERPPTRIARSVNRDARRGGSSRNSHRIIF